MSLRDLIERYDNLPLVSGSSDAVIKENIRREVMSGRPQKQAVAIAYSKAGRSNKKKKKASFEWRK